MRRFNICTKKTYKVGEEEKSFWPSLGSLTEFDQTQTNPNGGFALELNMFPEVKFYVFENKPKDQNQNTQNTPMPKTKEEEESMSGSINPDEIPF